MTVAELQKRISAKELSEWRAYARLNPFGEDRMDLRFALLGSHLFQAQGVKKKNGCDFVLGDFTLDSFLKSCKPKKQSLSEMNAVMQSLVKRCSSQ